MVKYLVDANLPYYFNLWNSEEYIHQLDVNPSAKDEEDKIMNKKKEKLEFG